jgi:hypothetical protein
MRNFHAHLRLRRRECGIGAAQTSGVRADLIARALIYHSSEKGFQALDHRLADFHCNNNGKFQSYRLCRVMCPGLSFQKQTLILSNLGDVPTIGGAFRQYRIGTFS